MTDGNGNGHKLKLTAKEFRTDQEVRWCPGCGDYAILAAMQQFMPELGIERERTVFVSGIGCAARFPYYMNTYGMHSIHGRAPAIATGLASSRPDLSVWVVTGDGDALSIGGNHLIHALRRNVNLKILLFNNKIYGLTKGQYSPTSELGKVTKSTPMGSLDWPFNPLSLVIGAEATFVARAIDTDKAGVTDVLRAAARASRQRVRRDLPELPDLQRRRVRLRARRQGRRQPDRATRRRADPLGQGSREGPAPAARTGRSRSARRPTTTCSCTTRRTRRAALAFALSRVTQETHGGTPVGVFRNVERPVYDDLMAGQIADAIEKRGAGDLAALLHSGETWTIANGFLLVDREVKVVAVRVHVELLVRKRRCSGLVEEDRRTARSAASRRPRPAAATTSKSSAISPSSSIDPLIRRPPFGPTSASSTIPRIVSAALIRHSSA